MRNQTARKIYGEGKSRSKPLAKMHHDHVGKTLSKKMMIRQRGYHKMMSLYEAVIRKTAAPIKIPMKKTRFAVKQGIAAMKSGFKLNINK